VGSETARTEVGPITVDHRLVVLVHGSLATPHSWRKVRDRLAVPSATEVVAPVVPGWDEPARDREPDTTVRELAEALARQVEPGGRPVVLAGFSNGATLCLQLALEPPWPITRLVLFDPNTIPLLALAGEMDDLRTAAATIEEFSARVRAGDPSATEYMVDYIFGPDIFPRLSEQARSHFQAYGPLNARDARAALARSYGMNELRTFPTPTVVVNGTNSPGIFKQVGASLARLLPDVQPVTIAGAGHQMLDTHPAEVAAIIVSACESERH
jgi:pimeloyl-ACP methyl ester carboxylesterase